VPCIAPAVAELLMLAIVVLGVAGLGVVFSRWR